ncbi:MAG: hypothetical protein E7667_02740 [Ruminococcaceae bacterium]|nr:hypothetical protein [Oscillospiraceae bacterium]
MKRILSLVLTLLLVFSLVACGGTKTDETASKSESKTEKPTENSTPAPTEKPTEKPSEKPTEKPTEGGTAKPDEAPEGIKYLRSDTGTQLNMILEYDTAKNQDGTYTVDATLKLESYSLNVTARGNSNYIKIGDENYYFSTEAITYSGAEKTTFTLATHRFTVSGDKNEVGVYAIWYFNGTYNDAPLATIVIDGKITLE